MSDPPSTAPPATLAAAVLVGAVVALAGCAAGQDAAPGDPAPAASGTSTSGTPTASSGPSSGASAAGGATGSGVPATPRTLRVTVEGTRVDPPPTQVDLASGDSLRLVVTADAGEAVHAHGLGDVEVPVTPGEPVQVDLVGGEPGVYEVELHDPDLLLLQVAVR